MQNNISLEMLKLFPDLYSPYIREISFTYQIDTFSSSDILLESYASLYGSDWGEINSDLDTCNWHVLSSNLQPINHILRKH